MPRSDIGVFRPLVVEDAGLSITTQCAIKCLVFQSLGRARSRRGRIERSTEEFPKAGLLARADRSFGAVTLKFHA